MLCWNRRWVYMLTILSWKTENTKCKTCSNGSFCAPMFHKSGLKCDEWGGNKRNKKQDRQYCDGIDVIYKVCFAIIYNHVLVIRFLRSKYRCTIVKICWWHKTSTFSPCRSLFLQEWKCSSACSFKEAWKKRLHRGTRSCRRVRGTVPAERPRHNTPSPSATLAEFRVGLRVGMTLYSPRYSKQPHVWIQKIFRIAGIR